MRTRIFARQLDWRLMMRQIVSSKSPSNWDQGAYIVFDDFRQIGSSWRVENADPERVICAKAAAIVFAALFLCALSSVAEARQRRSQQPAFGFHPSCNIFMPCELPTTRRAAGGRYVADQMGGFGSPNEQPHVVVRERKRRAPPYRRDYNSAPSHRIGGIVGALAAKVSEIQSSCGSKVISGIRRTRINGSGRMSLHASGKAVDMTGNPSCIYSKLQGWPGGYSTDYGRMRHVHISYDPRGGREMGLKFRHGGHRRHARRASS